jgi:hypothetical protein
MVWHEEIGVCAATTPANRKSATAKIAKALKPLKTDSISEEKFILSAIVPRVNQH